MQVIGTRFRKQFTLAMLAVAASMTGCASGPAFEKVSAVPPEKALIYVYRPQVMHGAVYSPEVNIGDQVKFPLQNGGYLPYLSAPGVVNISISNVGTRSITIAAVAGETYYVKGGTVFMGLGIPSIESVPMAKGLEEIKECKRLPDAVAQK